MKKLLFIPFVVLLVCVVALRSSPTPTHQPPDRDLESIAKYKQWTLVNPTPELMEPLPANSCARIPGRDAGSPHLHKYISVYVNPVGTEAMMTQRRPKFPVGSIVVKEKLPTADSDKPELLTAMIKREDGYNPDSGNWEYLVLDGAASAIDERGKLARCAACHVSYEANDFITRTYLPTSVRQKLKDR